MENSDRSFWSRIRLRNPLAPLKAGLAEADLSTSDLEAVERRVGEFNFGMVTTLARMAVYCVLVFTLPVLWIYRNDAQLLQSFVLWGGALLVTASGGLFLAQRLRDRAVEVFATALCLIVGVIGYSTSDLGGLDRPFVYAVLIAPFASLPLIVGLFTRTVITVVIVGSYLLGFFLPHPEYLAVPFLATPILNLVLAMTLSIAGGAMVTAVVRTALLHQPVVLRSTARRRESEARYQELIESIDDVVAVFDTEGRCTYISPPAKRLTGYDPPELVGRKFADLVSEEDSAKVAEYFRQCREGQGKPRIAELRVTHRNGSTRWVRSSARPVYADGRFRGIRSTFGDITARVREATGLPEGRMPGAPHRPKPIGEGAAQRISAIEPRPTVREQDAEVREQFWAESRKAIPPHLRIFAGVFTLAFLALAMEDWVLYPDLVIPLFVVKLVTIASLAALAFSGGTSWGVRHAIGLGIALSWVMMSSSLVHATYYGETTAVAGVTMIMCILTSVEFSWHPRYQLANAAFAVITILAAAFLIDGSLRQQSNLALLVACGSVLMVHLNGRRLFSLWSAEKALRESEKRFRNLGDHSSDIIWIWSVDRKIEYVSPVYESFTGRSCQTLYDRPVSVLDAMHPDDHAAFVDSIERVLQGEFRKMDLRVSHPDGTLYSMEAWATPIYDERGEVSLCIGIWRDVTERVRLVEELDAYSRVVAHDLKNPIAVISGYVELLEMRFGADLNEDDQSLIQGTLRTCGTMTTIVNELLLLAHVRSLDRVSVVPLNMTEIVGEVMDRLSVMISDSGAEIVVPDSWPVAEGYAAWVQEMWANYLSNSIKYGASPPRVELGAKEEGNGLLRFWVMDNGDGISEEDQGHLFREFSRLQSSQTDSHGLGLSIVKRIAEKLGGKVGVESSVGAGSTFWFTLPASGPLPPAAPEEGTTT